MALYMVHLPVVMSYLRKRMKIAYFGPFHTVSQVAHIAGPALINCGNVVKWWVGMPVMSQRKPKNFKIPLDQQKIILLGHCWGIVGWYTNDKFVEAQPEAIVGKWLVGA